MKRALPCARIADGSLSRIFYSSIGFDCLSGRKHYRDPQRRIRASPGSHRKGKRRSEEMTSLVNRISGRKEEKRWKDGLFRLDGSAVVIAI